MDAKIVDEMRVSLHRLLHQECWGIGAGEGTGSVLNLHIGEKLLRQTPVANPYLANDLQKYEGEMGLFIECAWRVDSDVEVMCGSGESNINHGLMIEGLGKITGHKIEHFDLLLPAYDLILHFSNSLTLRVFCDQTELTGENDNYSIFFPEVIYVVGSRSEVRREY